MPGARVVHLVVPEGIDDPRRPSGGNVYDRRLREGLRGLGWEVREHRLAGGWPHPTPDDLAALATLLADVPDAATVLVDGLIGSAAPPLAEQAARLRLVVLLHMPLAAAVANARVVEGAVLRAADAVLAPSRWARSWVVAEHEVLPERVHLAVPGTDEGPVARGSGDGAMLCVGPVVPDKGHDTLLAALADLASLEWHCTCAGALDLDPGFFAQLRKDVEHAGLASRVTFTGPVPPARLDDLRSTTDLTVSASRRESYGMAVAEGLARGIPAVATDVGGHPEALGAGAGHRPGVLVPPDDPRALAAALRSWLTDAALRERLRRAASQRRQSLPCWPDVVRTVADVLASVSERPTPVAGGRE